MNTNKNIVPMKNEEIAAVTAGNVDMDAKSLWFWDTWPIWISIDDPSSGGE